ncbi:MAG: M17 family peptidase N-terminal domain-containing protein [Gemmataceae bacterium]
MDTTLVRHALADVASDWLIVPFWENDAFPAALGALDAKLGGLLARLRERGDMTGKAKELTPIVNPSGAAAARLMLVGLGPKAKAEIGSLIACASAAARAITTKAVERIAIAIPEGAVGGEAAALAMGLGVRQGSEGPGLRKSKAERFAPKQCILVGPNVGEEEGRRAARRADIEGRAVGLARELVNLPPCDLYPESFADRARDVAHKTGLEIVSAR